MDRRIKWLDISRGIGVLCVIISHDLFFPDTVNEFLDSFFMPLFFVGGGVSLAITNEKHPNETMKEFLNKKFFSLIMPIFIFGFINYLYNGIAYFAGLQDEWHILLGLLGIFINMRNVKWADVFWFLSAFFVAEIIIKFLITKIYYIYRGKLLFILSMAAMYAAGFAYLRYVKIVLPWNIDIAVFCASYIGLGFLLWDTRYIDKIAKPKAMILMLAAATIAYALMPDKSTCSFWKSNFQYPFLMLFTSVGYSLFVMAVSKLMHGSSFLEFLGRNSLQYYALGRMIQTGLYKAMTLVGKNLDIITLSILDFALALIISTVCVIIYNKFYSFLVRKIRIIKCLQ